MDMQPFDLDFIACNVNYIFVFTIVEIIVTVVRGSNIRDGSGCCC